MLYLRLRFLLIALFIALGFVLWHQVGLWSAIAPFTGALLLIISFIFLGTVGPSFARLKRGQIKEADRLINLTQFPNLLLKRHRAYYHFTKGMIDLQRERLDKAETHFLQALDLGLRNANDFGFAALNLAHIHYVKKDFDQSRIFLDRCKSFQPDDLMIGEKVGELEKALAGV